MTGERTREHLAARRKRRNHSTQFNAKAALAALAALAEEQKGLHVKIGELTMEGNS